MKWRGNNRWIEDTHFREICYRRTLRQMQWMNALSTVLHQSETYSAEGH